MNSMNVMLNVSQSAAPASGSSKTAASAQGTLSFQTRLTKTQAAAQQDAAAPDPKDNSFTAVTDQAGGQPQAGEAAEQSVQAQAKEVSAQPQAGKQTVDATAQQAGPVQEQADDDLPTQAEALPWAQLMTLVQQLLTQPEAPAAQAQSPSTQLLQQLTAQAAPEEAAGQTPVAELAQAGQIPAAAQASASTAAAQTAAVTETSLARLAAALQTLVAAPAADTQPQATAAAQPAMTAEQLLQAVVAPNAQQMGQNGLLAALSQPQAVQPQTEQPAVSAGTSRSSQLLQSLLQQNGQTTVGQTAPTTATVSTEAATATDSLAQGTVQLEQQAAPAQALTPSVADKQAAPATSTAQLTGTAEAASPLTAQPLPVEPAAGEMPVQTAAQSVPRQAAAQPQLASLASQTAVQITTDQQPAAVASTDADAAAQPLPAVTATAAMPEQTSQHGDAQTGQQQAQVPLTPLPADSTAATAAQTQPAGISSFTQQLQEQVQSTSQTAQPQAPVQQDYQIPQQIVEQARLLRRGADTQMVIHLKPEHLGELTLKVAVGADGAVNASFHSNNAEVRTIIQNSLAALRQDLNNQGLRVDNVDVYAGLEGGLPQQDSSQQGWQQQGSNQQNLHSTRESAEAFADEAELNTALAAQQAAAETEAAGVDYRV